MASLGQTFASIKDTISTVNLKLEGQIDVLSAALLQDLERLSVLAKSFSELRSQASHTSWSPFIDDLDSEGVNLWNITGLAQSMPENERRTLTAALRLAGFHLIEAGIERNPELGTLLRVLQLATKAASSFLELGEIGPARDVLTVAAKYEAMISSSKDTESSHRPGRAAIVISYFCSRMEAAWKEDNLTLADFMSKKIIDYTDYALLGSHDKRLLADKHHDIGKSILKTEPQQDSASQGTVAQGAVQWLQKAFSIADHLDNSEAPTADLKISILRSLARAYFLSSPRVPENLGRAEAALQELFASIQPAHDTVGPEYLELKWQWLFVLKKRNADEASLLAAYRSIIDSDSFSDSTVTDILQDLRTQPSHSLTSDIHFACIQRISRHQSNWELLDKLLLSAVFHCSKDTDHGRAMCTLTRIFEEIYGSEKELNRPTIAACLQLLWKYGGQRYAAQRWRDAAEWFSAGSHAIFQTLGPDAAAKSLRKAALCHLEEGEFAMASVLTRRCPADDAGTQFVMMLAAIRQSAEDEAIAAVNAMAKAPDFDRQLLLLATKLAHESQMKNLLLIVLELLLEVLGIGGNEETLIEALTVIRCIVRLTLKLLNDRTTDKSTLISTLVGHFETAKNLVDAATKQKALSAINKHASWLWRTAYNTAIHACAEWDDNEEEVAALFDVAAQILKKQCSTSPADFDTNLYLHIAYASFSAAAARVFGLRRRDAMRDELQKLTTYVHECRHLIAQIATEGKVTEEVDIDHTKSFIHTLCVFEAELLVKSRDWDTLQKTVNEIVRSNYVALYILEAIVDIVWAEKDCPTNVLFMILEAILHSSLDRNSMQVDKFSRWLRAICTIALVKGSGESRSKAIDYVEQGVTVMERHQELDAPYPLEERQWLLGTAYNTGVECLQASLFNDAKRWLEVATIICRFLPDGQQRLSKISDTYACLLSRYDHKI